MMKTSENKDGKIPRKIIQKKNCFGNDLVYSISGNFVIA